MDFRFHWLKTREHRFQCLVFQVLFVSLCDVVVLIHVSASKQITDNHHSILDIKSLPASVSTSDNFPFKEFDVSFGRPLPKSFLCLFLKSIHEIRVTLIGDDCQLVNLLDIFSEFLIIHSVSLLVHADTQATTYLLSLGYG